jgi:hypothetical protein
MSGSRLMKDVALPQGVIQEPSRRFASAIALLFVSSCTASLPATKPASRPASMRWYTAADSTVPAGHVLTANRRCLKEVGCPFAVAALPECPDEIPTQQSLRDSGDVLIAGVLGMTAKGRIVAAGCPQGYCCERHERLLQVTTQQGLVVVLFDDTLQSFTCKGDQSLVCCGVPLDVPVVVKGRLGWLEELESHLVMRNPEICQMKK